MSRDQLTFSRSLTMVGLGRNELKRPTNLNDAELAYEFRALACPPKIKHHCDETANKPLNSADCVAIEAAEFGGSEPITASNCMEPDFQILSQQFPVQFPAQGFRHRFSEVQGAVKLTQEKSVQPDNFEPGNRKPNGVQIQKQGANQQIEFAKATGSFEKSWPGLALDNASIGLGEHLANSAIGILTGVQNAFPAQIANGSNASSSVLKNVQVGMVHKNATGKLTSIELALEPAELGRITARLEMSQDRLVLLVTTENRQAAELLSQDSSLLLRALSHHIGGIENMSVIIRQDQQDLNTSGQQDPTSLHSKQQRGNNRGFKEQSVFEQNHNETSPASGVNSFAIKAGILI